MVSTRLKKSIRIAGATSLGILVILCVINWPRFRDRKLLHAADSGDTAAVRLWLRLGGDLKAQLYPGGGHSPDVRGPQWPQGHAKSVVG